MYDFDWCPELNAIRMHTRAGPEALVFEDAPIPEIGPDDVQVRVRGAGITPTEFTWNSTFTTKDNRARLPIIPAFETSGVVEKVQHGGSGLSEGDAVYGLLDFWRDGAAAEYVAARALDMALKPEFLDFVQSAAIPLSGLTAWQALFEHAQLSPGSTILIHGAGGGVGTFAVQMARWKGAHIIATCSKEKTSLVTELGADEVIEYSRSRFDDVVRDIDVVLDTVGGDTLERSWRVLRKGGTLVTIVEDAPEAKAASFGVRGVSMLVHPSRTQLNEISRLVDQGKIKPVVRDVYPLSEARAAYERGMARHNTGKTVLKVA
jgi:NADPH:quinone reductase-like Zn-dependent oxidoreductase